MEDKYEEFLEKIKNKEPFSFSRWGDGEWSAITGSRPETHSNVDGHPFYANMGMSLARVLKSKPKYYLGMQRFAFEETHQIEIAQFLAQNNLKDLQWVNADVWHHASIHGEFEKFFEVLKDRRVYLVAPEYLKNVLPYNVYVEVPGQNCWLYRESVIDKVASCLFTEPNENVVVLFCASMPTKVMIDDLYTEFGDKHTLIDMGSVFDPYVGKKSRGYHKKIIERLNEKV